MTHSQPPHARGAENSDDRRPGGPRGNAPRQWGCVRSVTDLSTGPQEQSASSLEGRMIA